MRSEYRNYGNYTITEVPFSSEYAAKICPDFIYNRFDLFMPDSNTILKVVGKSIELYVPVHIYRKYAKLGVWLTKITKEKIDCVIKYLFINYRKINYVTYKNELTDYKGENQHNHFHIELPKTEEELHQRLSSKGRYNLQREKSIITEIFDDCSLQEFYGVGITDKIMEDYFIMKRKTHGTDYRMTPWEYIDTYHVSNAYVLKFGDTLAAILLSCEQCQAAYLENLTYWLNFSKYSPGQVAYDIFLEKLIKHQKKELFLAGGSLGYKKRYGSIETMLTDDLVYRNRITALRYKLLRNVYRLIESLYVLLPEVVKNQYRERRHNK